MLIPLLVAAAAADAPELPCPFASIATNVPLQLSGMPRHLLHAAAASCTIVAVIREAFFPQAQITKYHKGP